MTTLSRCCSGLVCSLLLLALAVPSHAQSTSFSPVVHVDVVTGYNTFDMTESSTFFRQVVDVYRDQNLDMRVQQSYPGNVRYGADVRLDLQRWLSVGVGTRYSRTQAASLYGDIAGTVDILSKTNLWTLTPLVRVEWPHGPIHPFLSGRGGLVRGRYSINEVVAIDPEALDLLPVDVEVDPEDLRSKSTLDASGTGWTATAMAGLRVPVGRLSLLLQGGHRWAYVDRPDADGRTNGEEAFTGALPFTVEYSGWTVDLGASLRLFGP